MDDFLMYFTLWVICGYLTFLYPWVKDHRGKVGIKMGIDGFLDLIIVPLLGPIVILTCVIVHIIVIAEAFDAYRREIRPYFEPSFRAWLHKNRNPHHA